jgi:hypothetical protein
LWYGVREEEDGNVEWWEIDQNCTGDQREIPNANREPWAKIDDR